MTKQNTDFEHGDVDIPAVEYSSTSETNASPASSEAAGLASEASEATVTPPVAETGTSSEEDATKYMPQDEASNFSAGQGNQKMQEELPAGSQAEPEEKPAAAFQGSSIEGTPIEEEVRPFTDFIEEFRQAEGRFNSSLQAYQAEALSSLIAGVEEAPVEAGHGPSEESKVDVVGTQSPATASAPASEQERAKEAEASSESPAPPVERPVSPLLRPASRLRLPRHGGGRHREEQPVEKPAEAPKQVAGGSEVEPAVKEPAPVEEQPRPARRYRFDRPAPSTVSAVAASSSQVQSRSEENKDTSTVPVSPRLENGRVPNGQISEKEIQEPLSTKSTASEAQSPEQGILKRQPVVQEAPTAESGSTATPVIAPAQEHDRRRRERQRSKEQPAFVPAVAAVPIAEIAATTPEPMASQQKEEVSPEDLPPLEYAELQKASSRRRRRRHTGSSAAITPVAAKAAIPEVPPVSAASTPAQMPFVMPSTPGTPSISSTPARSAAPANQSTITSGYTVKQMNQGHDGGNPFMGPEPSPARGSTAAQNVRSIRTDVQRTPAYPVRTTEATSASVHQLASIVAQAIQTQTDRMVAELRLANQAPTNVSVTMPPFPSNERVGVFVDVANLLYSARTLRMTVDFGKLLDFLRGNRRLVRAQAYCPTSPQPGDEQMFLQAVKGLGYRITTKNYKTFSSGAKKADLDLDLCMDVVRLVDGKAVDCVVLVSGDSDFMPMLDYCSDHGVRVEVAAFDEAMSATLRQSCDLFINLSMLDQIRA